MQQRSLRHVRRSDALPAIRHAIFIGFIVVLATAAAVAWIGSRRQQRTLVQQIDRLARLASADQITTSVGAQVIDTVPAPVARYLGQALPTATSIREVRIGQTGTLRTDVRSDRWLAFTAEHLVVPQANGFVWNARVELAPLLHVRVRDALVDGRGYGHVALLSAFTVSSASATPEMNSGSLHRYLAEAVWYPTALQPSDNLRWTQIDGRRALATLTVHGTTVALEFRFAESGEVESIYTPARWGTFDGGYKQLPWEGHFRDYRGREGVVVPTEGDVGWYVGGAWQPVWEGRITEYDIR